MTITTGSFDEHGIPQGARNTLDDISDVDAEEVKEGDTISYAGGRWITIPGNEVMVSNTQPEDIGVELWVNPLEGDPGGGNGGGGGTDEVTISATTPSISTLELWVDTSASGTGVITDYVLKAGDVMTGPLSLPLTSPSNPEHAANKAYVDSHSGGVTDHGALTGLSDPDHPIAAVQGLQGALDGKSPTVHSHAVGDLPATLATDAEVTSAISTHAAAADPHTEYQKESEKGVANGYASLDGTGKVPTAQLPAAGGGGVTDHGALTGLADNDHPQYVSKSGGADAIMTGILNVDNGGVRLVSPSGSTNASFQFHTDWVGRWSLGKNGDPESTGDAGSNFNIARYSDTGAWIDNALSITRATGQVDIHGNLTVARVGSGAQVLVSSDTQWSVATVSSDAEYAEFRVDAPTGKTAGLLMRQAAKTFWKIAKSSSAAGDLTIGRYDDAGVYVSTPLSISRTTGKTTIADLNYQDEGLMVAATGWADYGSSYGGLLCTKHAGMVTLEGMFKRTGADLSLGSTTVLVGTIPVGFRSVHDFTVPVQAWISTGYPTVRGIVYSNGELRIQAMPAVTIATNGWVSFVVTYRQGN